MSRSRSMPAPARRQRGAVLYVALIMLLLIALLGVAGMQVAGLQEKMASNYHNTHVAFENAETSIRTAECFLNSRVNRKVVAGCGSADVANVPVEEICETDFDATNWAKGKSMGGAPADGVSMRSIGRCISGQASLALGRDAEKGGEPNPVYQVTAYATDNVTNPSADAAIDTVFMP